MKSLSVAELRDALSQRSDVNYGDDFLIMDFNYKKSYRNHLVYPVRFEGVTCMFCLDGEFDLNIGFDNYEIKPDNFAIALPEDIVTLKNRHDYGKLRILAVSSKLLQDMDFDLGQAQRIFRHRVIKADRQYKIKIHYFRNLYKSIISDSHENTSKSLSFLFRAMEVEIAHIWSSLVEVEPASESQSPLTDTFFALVSKNHAKHRDLAFYATSLSLTPKYLSNTIKKATGKTAADWIQEYVILDSKFYLRNTEMTIKEIAFELGFDTQMDFYRYFQRHVGVAPSEFRRQPH